jgi:hypothetical protein
MYQQIPMPVYLTAVLGWMTEANKHMLECAPLRPVPWEHFQDYYSEHGERRFKAVEQKRYEECSVEPGPRNDVMVAAILVVVHGLIDHGVEDSWKRGLANCIQCSRAQWFVQNNSRIRRSDDAVRIGRPVGGLARM